MADNLLDADVRTSFGKGAARKLRAAGKIPAVIYGHGSEPVHVALPAHETTLIARRANALLDLKMPEDQQLVLIKDIQRDPVRQIIEHLDLVIVRKGEKVTVDIAVHVEGEPYPGTMVQLENNTVSVEAEATHIPESVSVSVEGMEEGTQVHAGELELPAGSTLVSVPEMLILSIQQPPKAEEETPVVAEESDAPAAGDSEDSGANAGGE
ncbi:MAG: 50S ribosomal protein L25/general stress protein Ctc [Microbacteriaceae bacterium]|jgi:large subunit ribosomal protein L25|nr:MAG: 50S ribosomal protein L25 [Microbacteriaceae bacterium BACL25 MAG-120322-bin65]|tara:strand:+ start:859 stop:1488 length:630 start_codon:yes stop_codon:yes gene_type:complete